MDVVKIAEICHETNKAYCEAVLDFTQLHWDQVPTWQKESAILGVKYCIKHPDATPKDMHWAWMGNKMMEGWKWGPVKDPVKKEHPCIVPYDELPKEQRLKDALFMAIIKVLKD